MPGPKIPDSDLLDEIRRLADESPPTSGEFKREAEYGTTTVCNRFGTWNTALERAGFAPNKERGISDSDLLNEIKQLAGENPPTLEKFEQEAEYGTTTVCRKFGTWNAALERAGFTPNKKIGISDRELLETLVADTSGSTAPPERSAETTFSAIPYKDRFGTWWRACVQAGLQPYSRRPLTLEESQQFFEATVGQQDPHYQLVGLLSQFTGMPPRVIQQLSEDWVREQGGETVVTVPPRVTQSGDRWTFKLPPTWVGEPERQDTHLPGMLNWILSQDGSIRLSRQSVCKVIDRIAQDAALTDRERTDRYNTKTSPLVRSGDLRATGGVQMARNGAPARRIRRHLGIEHTGWKASVEDFFLWLYVNEDYKHPDYEPPDVVLDPV